MIPYQIGDKTYFIPPDFFYDNIDKMSEVEFLQAIINGKYVRLDLEQSFDADLGGELATTKTFSKLQTDDVDRLWMKEEGEENLFET